jgi:putative tricarboxylic transport membrane protein
MHGALQRLGREGIAGCGILAAGIGGWLTVYDYPIGELSLIGPGFLPQALSTGLLAIGATMILRAVRNAAEPGQSRESLTFAISRPFLVIPLAAVVFAVAAPVLGLAVTSALAVFVASLATREGGIIGRIVLLLVLATVATLIFGYGLALPVPIWPPILLDLFR